MTLRGSKFPVKFQNCSQDSSLNTQVGSRHIPVHIHHCHCNQLISGCCYTVFAYQVRPSRILGLIEPFFGNTFAIPSKSWEIKSPCCNK